MSDGVLQRITADVCVIGAGSGGLTVAAGAARMGARTVLIERDAMGGECLNTGCVPSKALIAAARAAAAVRGAARFGILAGTPQSDFARIHDHIQNAIAAIAPNDSVTRFEGLGVTVLRGSARFAGPDRVRVGDREIRARRIVVATGSRPAIPPIPGLDRVPVLTNETLFVQPRDVAHLLVLGGGPVGVELAQAYRRLGAAVTLVEQRRILAGDDPELVAVVRHALTDDGVALLEDAAVARAEPDEAGLALVLTVAGGERRIAGSHLLVAAGRRPNVEDLGLDAAGVQAGPAGIPVDGRMRTANRRIYAVGDVAVGPRFTHAASYQAGIVLANALLRLPLRARYRALPRVTYVDPELAQVGLTEAQARAHGAVRVLRWPFVDNDRAQADGETAGLVKVVADARGRILGAGIAGPHAGEQIGLWVLAIGRRLRLKDIAGMIAPYPTFGEASKRAAGAFYADRLFSPWMRRLVRLLGFFG